MELSKLIENYDELTNLEKRVVEYIMNSPEEIVNITANELSKRLFISKTSIINLSKKLGFDGFIELRYYVKDYVINKAKKDEVISFKDILNDIYEEVTKTLSLQSEDDIKAVAEKLVNSKTVYIIARGASKPIGDLLSTRLSMLRIKSIYIDDYNLIDVIGDRLMEDETLVLISLSGETEKIKNIAKVARAKSVDVIAITSFSNNTLQKIANYKLFCFSDEVETKNDDLISRLGLHTIAQLLITYINNNEKR